MCLRLAVELWKLVATCTCQGRQGATCPNCRVGLLMCGLCRCLAQVLRPGDACDAEPSQAHLPQVLRPLSCQPQVRLHNSCCVQRVPLGTRVSQLTRAFVSSCTLILLGVGCLCVRPQGGSVLPHTGESSSNRQRRVSGDACGIQRGRSSEHSPRYGVV